MPSSLMVTLKWLMCRSWLDLIQHRWVIGRQLITYPAPPLRLPRNLQRHHAPPNPREENGWNPLPPRYERGTTKRGDRIDYHHRLPVRADDASLGVDVSRSWKINDFLVSQHLQRLVRRSPTRDSAGRNV